METLVESGFLKEFSQGSVLGPILYIIFTSNLPAIDYTITTTFGEDTDVLTVYEDSVIASSNLQNHLFQSEEWLRKRNSEIEEFKSHNVTFTLRERQSSPVFMNNVEIPKVSCVKYLGVRLDSILN